MIRTKNDAKDFVGEIKKGNKEYTSVDEYGNIEVFAVPLVSSICALQEPKINIYYNRIFDKFTHYWFGYNWRDQDYEEISEKDLIDLIYKNRKNFNVLFK